MRIMKNLSIVLLLTVYVFTCKAQIPASGKVSQEKMLERFLSYVKIESQSIDEPSMTSFPMTDGQRKLLVIFITRLRLLVAKV